MARCKWLAALVGLMFTQGAQAAAVLQQSFEEMTARSDLVVRGVAGRSRAAWEAGRIVTSTEVSVVELIKGEPHRLVEVRQPGGVVGDVGQRVEGAATFRLGEEAVLFLQRPRRGKGYVVLGMSAGKVRLQKTSLGTVAVRELEGIAFVAPGEGAGGLRALPREDLGSAEQFLARVRKAARAARRVR
jgi:hypothetical protein